MPEISFPHLAYRVNGPCSQILTLFRGSTVPIYVHYPFVAIEVKRGRAQPMAHGAKSPFNESVHHPASPLAVLKVA